METQNFDFNLGSRNLFPEEEPVVDAVKQAVEASAARHGLKIKQGSALFRVTAKMSATPTVHRYCGGIVADTVEKAVPGVPRGSSSVRAVGDANKPQAPSGIADARKLPAGSAHRPGAHRAY